MRPVSFVGMQAEPTQELRVVIKFVRAPVPQYSRYRLIAYGDEPAWAFGFEESSRTGTALRVGRRSRRKSSNRNDGRSELAGPTAPRLGTFLRGLGFEAADSPRPTLLAVSREVALSRPTVELDL